MAVTQEQVYAAADQLAADGARPTLEGVRKITGGSFTTITPLLQAWKAQQAAAATPLKEAAPQAVAERLAGVGAEIWAMALDLANGRLLADREALDKARLESQAAQAEAIGLADKLTQEVEALQASLAAAEAARDEARAETDRVQALATTAQAQAETAAARAEEIQRRAADLRTELDQAHAVAKQLRGELERAHHDADQVRVEMASARREAAVAGEAHDAQRKQAAAEVHRLAERLAALQTERDGFQRQATEAREAAARAAGQLEAHREQLAAVTARLSAGPGPAVGAPTADATSRRK